MIPNIEKAVLESVNFGIVALSNEGKIIYHNKQANSILSLQGNNNYDIFKLLPNLKDIIDLHNPKSCILSNHIISNTLKTNYVCEISSLIYDNNNTGYILVLKEVKKVLKMASSYKNSSTRYTFDDIIGESPQMKMVINQCKSIANSPSTVLITGESGCGKELIAQSIHNASDRSNQPFIAVNCGAIPKNLIESELFGYEAGAFTGSSKGGSPGKFELAHGGTIFLDEIGEMPLDMQVHLLRVLQECTITRIGSKVPTKIDIRVIAATNKDLKEEIKKGNFRNDLYYRLNVLPIKVPPLKDRIGDIPILLDYFLKVKSKKLSKAIPKVSQALFKKMITYCWPGNIREFENFIENLVALNGITSYEIDLEDCHCLTYDNLGNIISTDNSEFENIVCELPQVTPLLTLEKKEIQKALEIFNGNITKTAHGLGISRNALYNKINRYNIK
ncbi:MAG: sigma 54-interacting transcriptional regulator [Clostridium sp.]